MSDRPIFRLQKQPEPARSREPGCCARGRDGAAKHAGQLEKATLTLPPLPDNHVLVETLYGSWEGDQTHALERDPIKLRRLGQDCIVLGNSGVVRVLSVG